MEQHNHHCLLTFLGYNWRIVACRKNEIDVMRPIGFGHCSTYQTIYTAAVDWNAYSAAAVEMDRRVQC